MWSVRLGLWIESGWSVEDVTLPTGLPVEEV